MRKAFSEEPMKEVASRDSKFYLALEEGEIIGFCQMVPQGSGKAELDRIVMFQRHTARAFGSQLFAFAVKDQARERRKEVIVYAGKDERRQGILREEWV